MDILKLAGDVLSGAAVGAVIDTTNYLWNKKQTEFIIREQAECQVLRYLYQQEAAKKGGDSYGI